MSGASSTGLTDVLDALAVPRRGVVYVQSSTDWLARAGYSAAESLAALRDWTSDGTLVMPSYPFFSTHLEYLQSRPVFDLRRTPVAIGLLPEMLRRTAGAVRSPDPDFCVAAIGHEAASIAGAAAAGPDPFGGDSSYQRMLDSGATLVGLGVSLNTNSFIHLVDSRAGSSYPAPVYDRRVFPTTVIDASGASRDVLRHALRPAFQQRTSPSAIVAAMTPSAAQFSTLERDGARFFRWELDAWARWCLAHARLQSARGEWPCWLSALASEPELLRLG